METITVVIIIMILIIFGIVYAANQRQESSERERDRQEDYQAMEITTNTLNLDFLKCTEGGATHDSCIDYYQALSLSEKTMLEENYIHFYRLFGESRINITILKNITSPNQETKEIQLYTTRDTENKTTISVKIPITVRDPIRDKNYFSIMEVAVFR